MTPVDCTIALLGLQGSRLLGFLAAMGTVQTLSSASEFPSVQMRWVPGGSSFYPELGFAGEASTGRAVEVLWETLKAFSGHPTIMIDQDLKIPCSRFRDLAESQAEAFLSLQDLLGVDMVAALGCDAVGNDFGHIQDTAFRTMSGAGHQHFLTFMNELAENTTVEQLKEALFGPWRYRDPSPTMRWDAEDDRRYALRWDEPSKDPTRTVRGANRLAVAALPLFPVVPVSSSGIATTGFKGRKSSDTFFTWPIWSGWLSVDSIRSLLMLRDLQEDHPDSRMLSNRGVLALYRSQRITMGKYRNFTPSRSL